MLRLVSRFVRPQLKPQLALFKHPQNIFAAYKPNMFFSSAEGIKEVSPIASSFAHVLRRCQTFSDLFYHFDKRDRFLTFNHLALMIRKFHDFQQSKPTNVMLETNYNQIISRIVQQCEQGSEDITAGDIASIYFCLNQIPYSNQFTKRCNFVIEQKGVALFQEMNPFETSLFFMTLVKNKKKGFAQTILPYITMNVQEYKLGILTKTLDSVVTLDIKALDLALKVKDILLSTQKIEKLRPKEFSYALRFFGQYPDIEDGPELFRRLEARWKWITKEVDGETINSLITSLTDCKESVMSLDFYDGFATRVKELEYEVERDKAIALMKYFTKYGVEYLITRNDFALKFFNESETLDAESLIILLYHLSKNRSYYPAETDSIIKNLMSKGPLDLDAANLEYLLNSYGHISTKRGNQFYQVDQKFLMATLIRNFDSLAVNRIPGVVFKLLHTNDIESLKRTFELYQAKFLKQKSTKEHSFVEIKNMCALANIFLTRLPGQVSKQYLDQLIDYTLKFMHQQVGTTATVLYKQFFEPFGKFLSILVNLELSAENAEKRLELLNATKQFLLKINQEKGALPDELLIEKNLLLYIKTFYSAFETPGQEIERMFADALNLVGPNNLNSSSVEYLSENTPFGRESAQASSNSVEHAN